MKLKIFEGNHKLAPRGTMVEEILVTHAVKLGGNTAPIYGARRAVLPIFLPLIKKICSGELTLIFFFHHFSYLKKEKWSRQDPNLFGGVRTLYYP